MRFLADESCDAEVIRAIRQAAHEVTWVRETMPGATDRLVLNTALVEQRVLITEDKDFGELVFARGAPALGVLLLRYPPAARPQVTRKIVAFVADHAAELVGSFVVIGPSRTRLRRLR
jgi:predicted nuclease of predicted toxin-antitoxin system